MSKTRPAADFPRNEPGLVDRYIGDAYSVVKAVYEDLPLIKWTNKNIEEFNNSLEGKLQDIKDEIDSHSERIIFTSSEALKIATSANENSIKAMETSGKAYDNTLKAIELNTDSKEIAMNAEKISKESNTSSEKSLKIVTDLETKVNNIEEGMVTDYQSMQAVAYARFMRKLREDGNPTINAVGTSNTSKNYGNVAWIESLSECLSEAYQTEVQYNNLGVSGGRVKLLYEKWKGNTPDADVTIMEFTANDQARTEIGQFVLDLEEYIEYELESGRAVILMTPPKTSETTNTRRDVYAGSMYSIAEKYGIRIINGKELMINYRDNMRYDAVHYNSEGNTILGYKLAAFFIGDSFQNPVHVYSGTTLLGRPVIDNLVLGLNSRKYFASGSVITPLEVKGVLGITTNYSGQEGEAYTYQSFYAEEENLYIVPNFRLYPGATIEFTLDGGTDIPDYSNKENGYIDLNYEASANNTYSYTNTSEINHINRIDNMKINPIPLITKGWHILRVKVTNNIGVMYSNDFYNGLDLKTIELHNKNVINSVPVGHIIIPLSDNRKPEDILSTYIPFEDIKEAFGLRLPFQEEFKNPLFKLTWADAMSGEEVVVKSAPITQGSNWYAVTDVKVIYDRRNDTEVTSQRKFGEITSDENGLIINWEGRTTRHGSLTITLY